MNYLAHGYRYTDDPYFLAGTAVPDWLNVVDRRVRARSKYAKPFAESDDPRLRSLARGIMQHHQDDAWFHSTRSFAELSLQFTKTFRDALPPDDGFRPSFLGHILVELLLDAVLTEERPQRLEDYYRAVDQVDGPLVEEYLARMTPRRAEGLGDLIPKFSSVRFLSDYADDAKLCFRLNQVMRRVKLPELPDSFAQVLPEARRQVRQARHELMTPSVETR